LAPEMHQIETRRRHIDTVRSELMYHPNPKIEISQKRHYTFFSFVKS